MKKIFLSLSAIALLAVGTVSCGSDDSSDPAPAPGLTENFIEVDGEQSEITYSIYAVHVDGAGNSAPFKEYTLQDGTVVIAFEFISHAGTTVTGFNGVDNTFATLLTKVDTTKAVGQQGRYVYPFTTEGTTLYGGFTTNFSGVEYTYSNAAEFALEDLVYATETAAGSMNYVLAGPSTSTPVADLITNLNGEIDGLYSLNVSTAAKNALGVAKVDKFSKLTLRKGL